MRPDPSAMRADRRRLRQYADVVGIWCARFDTAEIAERTGLAESLVVRWIWNYREMMRAAV